MSYKNSLSILWLKHLSDIWIVNIFFQSTAYLFGFLTLSFKETKISNFDEVQFIHFSFIVSTFCLRNLCLPQDNEDSLFFPPRSVIIWFRSMIDFQLIFLCSMRSKFIIFHTIFWAPFIEQTTLLLLLNYIFNFVENQLIIDMDSSV